MASVQLHIKLVFLPTHPSVNTKTQKRHILQHRLLLTSAIATTRYSLHPYMTMSSSLLRLAILVLLHYFVVQSHAFSISPPTTPVVRSPLKSVKSDTLTLFSPCKINLFLRILRKREDGYHDLASLFQAIGFGDTLELTLLLDSNKDDDEFECNMPGVPVDQSNLVLRALTLMREKTCIQTFFKANLIKSVPAQAGLGGGSANAATAMYGANELMGRPATLEQLVEWSGELGSDITFFFSRGTAYCTGRGEIMTPIEPPLPSGTKVCLVKPNVGLSTPAVFKALDYDKLSKEDPETLLEEFILKGVEETCCYINDLEPPAFTCVPLLASLKEELQQEGFQHVLMSGSGTTIFCIGEPSNQQEFVKKFGSRSDLQVFFSEFINRKEGEWFTRPSTS